MVFVRGCVVLCDVVRCLRGVVRGCEVLCCVCVVFVSGCEGL